MIDGVNENHRTIFKIFSIIFIIFWAIPCLFFGILFTGLSGFIMNHANEKLQNYTPVKGYVVDYYSSEHSSSENYVAEYIVNGQSYKVTSSVSTNVAELQKPIGAEVLVKYNPKNPKDAIIADDKAAAVFNSVFLIFGIIAILLGLGSIALLIYVKKLIFGNNKYISYGNEVNYEKNNL